MNNLFQEVDIGAAPLYITEHRAKVVDFSVPFLKTQATLLLRKPPVGQPLKIKSVADLINQSEIKYGTLNTGLLLWSFRNTNDSVLKLVYRKMQRFEAKVFMESNLEGINKVRREKFAYILPSTIGDYITQKQPCDLMTLDTFLMDRGFGLAVQKASPLLPLLNNALNKLRKNGFLRRNYVQWWFRQTECADVKSSLMVSVNSGVQHNTITSLNIILILAIFCIS